MIAFSVRVLAAVGVANLPEAVKLVGRVIKIAHTLVY